LESWPSKSDWLEERWAYRAAEKPPVPQSKPAIEASVDLKPLPPVTDPGNSSSSATPDQSDPISDPQASPRPIYPWQAISRRLQGVVQVLVEVDSNGNVVSARVAQTSGHGILDRAALEGVKKWKFLPAQKEGKAVPGAVLIPIRFHFQDR
jgi:protein TonB